MNYSARRRRLAAVLIALTSGAVGALNGTSAATDALSIDVPSLDGSGNNLAHPTWGTIGENYSRIAPANYADGRSAMVNGPDPRYVADRIFSDLFPPQPQGNIFDTHSVSENQVSEWGWVWAQFLAHNIDLTLGSQSSDPQGEPADVTLNPNDPFEALPHPPVTGKVPFTRSYPAAGTGVTNARQSVNMAPSYLDA